MRRIINTAMQKCLTYYFTDKLFPDVIHLQKKIGCTNTALLSVIDIQIEYY